MYCKHTHLYLHTAKAPALTPSYVAAEREPVASGWLFAGAQCWRCLLAGSATMEDDQQTNLCCAYPPVDYSPLG